MVLRRATVEHDRRDALGLCTRRDERADRLGGRHVPRRAGSEIRLDRGGRGDRLAEVVIDDLGDDVLIGTEDREARTRRGSVDLAPDALVTPGAQPVDSLC